MSSADALGFPWDLHVRPGAERTERMSLADLAGDPLLALPALPPGGYLPPKPYPEPLQPFTLREAHVFGRSDAVHLGDRGEQRRQLAPLASKDQLADSARQRETLPIQEFGAQRDEAKPPSSTRRVHINMTWI